MHCDSYGNGSPDSGTVDFWPNGGTRVQPGCSTRFIDKLSGEFFRISLKE